MNGSHFNTGCSRQQKMFMSSDVKCVWLFTVFTLDDKRRLTYQRLTRLKHLQHKYLPEEPFYLFHFCHALFLVGCSYFVVLSQMSISFLVRFCCDRKFALIPLQQGTTKKRLHGEKLFLVVSDLKPNKFNPKDCSPINKNVQS